MLHDLAAPSTSPAQASTPLMHSPERAAERLELGRTTVYELIRTGELESVKVGRLRRIPEVALVEFVERLRRNARATTGQAA